ncbi:MAG: transcription elongation factor subunit Spt4 [Candidatus Micrarchaeota archaeon]
MAKVCKNCQRIYGDVDVCPQCEEGKNQDFSDRFNSSVLVLNPEESKIAKKLGFKTPGMYAIKVK